MRRLEFDFVRRRPQWPGWLVGAFGLALAFDAVTTYAQLDDELRRRTDSAVAASVRPAAPEVLSEQAQREVDAARRLLLEMALPWDPLFRSIEGALGKDVALLAVEPDAARHSVQIIGEARSYLAVLNFVARLNQDPTLTRVHLLEHAVRKEAPEQPLRFTLMASWGAPR